VEGESLEIFKKTGAGEGIRILDPNLGKIQIYEISHINQVFTMSLGVVILSAWDNFRDLHHFAYPGKQTLDRNR
jgi:hypothetical protein